MIYLIGGTPRSGKSTLAKKLAASLGVSWISADTLEGLAKHFTPPNEYSKKFSINVIRKETKNSNDLMYSKYTAEQIKKAYIKQAESSWKTIKTLIEYLLGEDQDYIIEGYQIAPKFVSKLQKKFADKIKCVFLTRHSVEKIIEDAKKSTAHNDWFITKTKNEATYPKIALMIAKYGDYIKKEAEKYNYDLFNMDVDFMEKLDLIVKKLSIIKIINN
jgi:2-phosphoglycerate kinase